MTGLCTATFAKLAQALRFSCSDVGGLISLHNPLRLQNPTLPVLEVMMVAGAVFALVYAIVRLRRHHDPTNLAVWLGACAYLVIIEPPLYFPEAFGVSDHIDIVFAHNLFTVEFLYGRLPLYIVALYPAMATLAFEIVRSLGVFRDRGVVVGALCVGFVHHAFYEIFDQLGPQLRWWAWDPHNPFNQPMFSAVPYPSMVVFATLWPTALAFFVALLVGRPTDRGSRIPTGALVLRIVGVCVFSAIGVTVLGLPGAIGDRLDPGGPLKGAAFTVEVLIVCLVAIPTMARQWSRARRDRIGGPGRTDIFVSVFGAGYLAVMGALWISGLPAYFGADAGVTAAGTPTGSFPYALASFVVATLCLLAAVTAHSSRLAGKHRLLWAPAS